MKLPLRFIDRGGKLVVRGVTEIEDTDGVLLAEVITIESGFEHYLKSLKDSSIDNTHDEGDIVNTDSDYD